MKLNNQTKLVGTWTLKSFQIVEDGHEARDWGRNPTGILIYTKDGYMSVAINREISKKDRKLSLPHIFYSGTYKLRKNEIIHKVQNASEFDRIGKNLIRTASLKGKILELVTHANGWHAVLQWRKK